MSDDDHTPEIEDVAKAYCQTRFAELVHEGHPDTQATLQIALDELKRAMSAFARNIFLDTTAIELFDEATEDLKWDEIPEHARDFWRGKALALSEEDK